MNHLAVISTDALKAMLAERQARLAAVQAEIDALLRELETRQARRLQVVR
jgi:uncharacterized coiled-coil protein SlyX